MALIHSGIERILMSIEAIYHTIVTWKVCAMLGIGPLFQRRTSVSYRGPTASVMFLRRSCIRRSSSILPLPRQADKSVHRQLHKEELCFPAITMNHVAM